MDKLYHAIAKTISLFKKGQYDSKSKFGLKNLLGYLKVILTHQKNWQFLTRYPKLPFFLSFLNKKIFFGAPQPTEMTYFGFTYFMDGP